VDGLSPQHYVWQKICFITSVGWEGALSCNRTNYSLLEIVDSPEKCRNALQQSSNDLSVESTIDPAFHSKILYESQPVFLENKCDQHGFHLVLFETKRFGP
jgi:hypothetical protein